MQFISMGVLIKRIKAIKSYLLDPAVSKWKKLLVVFGIIYLLSPLDLVPEPVLGFGIIDDIALWSFILWYLKDELDRYDETVNVEKANRKVRKSMRGKKIYDVEVTVVDDDREEPGDGADAGTGDRA